MRIIYPEQGKVILSRDEYVRIGKYIIGTWDKDYAAGSSHFRPSANEGRLYYRASLNNGDYVDGWTMAELRESIVNSCKDGIEPEE